MFYWTPPHFWALALMRKKEYAAAGVPMLPVVAGERETHRQIVIYSVLMILVSALPVFLLMLGPVYLVISLVLNGVFLWDAVEIYRRPTNQKIWRLYKYSLLYLALLFIGMGVDRLFFTLPITDARQHASRNSIAQIALSRLRALTTLFVSGTYSRIPTERSNVSCTRLSCVSDLSGSSRRCATARNASNSRS